MAQHRTVMARQESKSQKEEREVVIAKAGPPLSKIELYVSMDIMQGEHVPFYLIWKGAKILSVELVLQGFIKIVKLYNVIDGKDVVRKGRIDSDNLVVPGYLGGVLSTKRSTLPYLQASLEAHLVLENGQTFVLREERILYTTRVRLVKVPDEISLPLTEATPLVEIDLEGSTTVVIEIEEDVESEIKIVLPREVGSAVERFAQLVSEGLDRLRGDFPKRVATLDNLASLPEGLSPRQYFDRIMSELDEVRNDKPFMETFSAVMLTAVLGQDDLRKAILLPLKEYFDSSVASKAFLDAPFHCANVSSEGGRFVFQLTMRDILSRKLREPILIDTYLKSKGDLLVPIKDLLQVRRR